jgi:predicted nuclease of predicted toxin-antitoxin system
MKFKLDENFGTRTQHIFQRAGHDVETVRQESLQGSPDEIIYTACCDEQRCLVTLDLDFANVTRFPPQKTSGIVVIRVSRNPSLTLLENLVREFLRALEQQEFKKQLWIVEIGRIRVHQQDVDEDE